MHPPVRHSVSQHTINISSWVVRCDLQRFVLILVPVSMLGKVKHLIGIRDEFTSGKADFGVGQAARDGKL
ncbi:MAG: hypothetical protein EOO38_24600 [Cytophagaceae bacterium]|nr:MAG: hypothetical protein EOO38_24600 [Cytophagaceae bacterium]